MSSGTQWSRHSDAGGVFSEACTEPLFRRGCDGEARNAWSSSSKPLSTFPILTMASTPRSTSAYLWTLPMFHCNGWCFTWGVTAVGGTHICLRRVDPVTKDFYPHFQWNLFEADSVVNYEMVTYGNIPSLTWLF